MQSVLKKANKWFNLIQPKLSNFALLGLIVFSTILTVYALFYKLGHLPIRLWDESRLAVSAIEMKQTLNWLTPTFEFQPDLWSTKPPFMIWLQVLSLHALGENEWAIRFPSAVAGLLTVVLCVYFIYRKFGSLIAGLISSWILSTSYGYINKHVTRTGDYDALLAFWCLLMLLSLWSWSINPKSKYIFLFAVSVVLSILTKGIQGLMVLPFAIGILFFMSENRKQFALTLSITLFISIAFAFLYYLLREKLNPGFLVAVWNNELGGRYLTSIEHHKGPFNFYFNLMYHHHFRYWFWFYILCLPSVFFTKNQRKKYFLFYLFTSSLGYLFIISFAQTKLEWYAAPVYPVLALQLGLGFYIYAKALLKFVKSHALAYLILGSLFIAIWAEPVKTTYYRFKNPEFYPWEKDQYNLSFYLQGLIRNNTKPPADALILNRYPAEILFYTYQLKKKYGFKLKKSHQIELPLTALVVEEDVKKQLSHQFDCSVENIYKDVSLFRIRLPFK